MSIVMDFRPNCDKSAASVSWRRLHEEKEKKEKERKQA